MGIVIIIKLEKHLVSTYIFGIIIGKLNYEKEPSPIIFFVINKNFKIGLYYIILPHDLAISFKIKNHEKLLLDFKNVV